MSNLLVLALDFQVEDTELDLPVWTCQVDAVLTPASGPAALTAIHVFFASAAWVYRGPLARRRQSSFSFLCKTTKRILKQQKVWTKMKLNIKRNKEMHILAGPELKSLL